MSDGWRHQRRSGLFFGLLMVGVVSACARPGPPPLHPPETRVAPFEIRLWSDRSQYRIGEPIGLFVAANADAYVTLIETDANGEPHVLFPNAFGRDHFVAGGRRYEIPGRNAEYRFSAAGPPGKETIRVIATRSAPSVGQARPLDRGEPPLGESSTEILIIDEADGGTLRERTIRPKRPDKPIEIIGVPGNRPNLAQGSDDHRQPPSPPPPR